MPRLIMKLYIDWAMLSCELRGLLEEAILSFCLIASNMLSKCYVKRKVWGVLGDADRTALLFLSG